MAVDSEKAYSVRLTRRQIEALVKAAADVMGRYHETQDLVGLANGKNELCATLSAITAHERPREPLITIELDDLVDLGELPDVEGSKP